MELDLEHMPPPPKNKDFRIGVIGAGFIVRDVQLVAYQRAGYRVAAIASQSEQRAREVAEVRGIPIVHHNWRDLLADPSVDVIDVAVPPHIQLSVIEEAVQHSSHIKGILAQKPLAMSYSDAKRTVDMCRDAGITLAVNQNMRYDQSIRALKTLLTRGDLGEPVLGTIEMRAIPHWQPWIRGYDKLTLLVMSIHHLDCFRYLFGSPASVYASARTDPRTAFPHRDGIVLYILEYDDGFRATAWDDVWGGPAREGAAGDLYIKWRVEGTDGTAQGTIGWPEYPNAAPSTIRFATKKHPGCWLAPQWKEVWFPDAFAGPMGELFDSIAERRAPAVSGVDNLETMALVDACYSSLDLHRPVALNEIKEKHHEAGTH